MTFTVSNFKSNMAKQGAGARPSLYKIDINGRYPTQSFEDISNLLVKAASIPAANIAPLPVNFAGRAYKWNGFRTYDIWTVTVINDEDFYARNRMMNWMRGISGHLDGNRTKAYGSPLYGNKKQWWDGDATVSQLGTNGEVKQVYKFYNLWPTEIAEIPVDWSSDAIQEYTIGFAYDYWGHGSGPKPETDFKDVINATSST